MKASFRILAGCSLLLSAASFTASCHKESTAKDCSGIEDKLTADKAAYSTDKTIAKCKAVETDYNNLLDGCDPDGSYLNSRDAFLTANNNCK